jgi:hypothetical protein
MPSLRALAVSVPKPVVAVVLPTAVVAVTGVAVSYWSAGGSGTGTATTASSSTALTVTQASAPTGMAPGIAPGPITVTVTNPGTSTVRANQVVVSIASVTGGSGPCGPSDYVLSDATMTQGAADLTANASTTFSGATLGFNNSSTLNQDGCKGATVNLAYVAG